VNTLAQLGGVVGAVGFAALAVGRSYATRLGGLVALAIGSAALAAFLAPDVSLPVLFAAIVGGLAVAVVGAAILERWPWALAFAILACVPVRIPIKLGAEEANLLVPLYAVAAAAALSFAWQLVRDEDRRSRELGPVAVPLAAFVGWTGLTLLWTDDLREGAIAVGAFVLPFGLLAISVARLPWRGKWLTWMWGGLVVTALAYAAIGMYQWGTREVFWNPKVIVGNAYAPFFRVNSVFWDPSIYGRYLVVGILTALAGVLLGGVTGRKLWGLVAVIALMWAGLFLSFSQTSFVALSVGVTAGAVVVWGRRALAAALIFAVVLALGTAATPQVRHRVIDQGRSGADKVTSGRASLVGQGARIAFAHPVLGVGVGGFKTAYAERTGLKGRNPKLAASHTTPVTVAAETGFTGLVLFAWLLYAALAANLSKLGRGFTSRVAFAVGLTLLAIMVHSLFYNAFFEDPLTWALLGLTGLAASVPRRGLLPTNGPEEEAP
jgi:O-antigen ligase